MTSNLGSELILNKRDYKEIKREIDQLLYKNFKPEFLNRIDEIITFKPLNQETIKEITLIEIKKLSKLLMPSKISIDITNNAISELAELGYNPALGARPLKRIIQREIQDKLSSLILEGKLLQNTRIKIDYRKDKFIFE